MHYTLPSLSTLAPQAAVDLGNKRLPSARMKGSLLAFDLAGSFLAMYCARSLNRGSEGFCLSMWTSEPVPGLSARRYRSVLYKPPALSYAARVVDWHFRSIVIYARCINCLPTP